MRELWLEVIRKDDWKLSDVGTGRTRLSKIFLLLHNILDKNWLQEI